MKLSYEHQGVRDADDADLARAIHHNRVPAGCLLGGVIVTICLERDVDPCSRCGIPRNKCQGRPANPQIKPIRPRTTAEVEAKTVERIRLIASIENILDGAKG
jgi:hypothetical protein